MSSWRDKHSRSFLSNADDTTPRILMQTIKSTRPVFRSLPGYEDRPVDIQDRIDSGLDCDEVYPNIFIGDVGAAKDKKYLQRIGVTHVLNTAEGNRSGMVNTNPRYYKDTEIKYMGVHLVDVPVTNIGAHFHETANFIEEGVKTGGKVMVHCLMGMSRSSTCVLSYLMIKEGLCATEALRTVRSSRDIRPNEGFLQQLADLDNKLRRERQSRHPTSDVK